MADLSVKTLQGSLGIVSDIALAKKLAREIKYPILLKARAGGGGKGMRLVDDEAIFEKAYLEAQLEAESAFGDQEIYLEKSSRMRATSSFKCWAHLRYVVCLGERECSIQRKKSKADRRSASKWIFRRTSTKNDQHFKKCSQKKSAIPMAGTVEFLVKSRGELYFMEMNTRIRWSIQSPS